MAEPLVCLAILAHNKEHALPIYLKCIESLDYPKERMALYIRTNNNNDKTIEILEDWITKNKAKYNSSYYDATDIEGAPKEHGRMEWTEERFKILGKIRQDSVNYASAIGADYYFVVDCDNFITPSTLKSLISLQLPVVAPFLRVGMSTSYYSNFHADIDEFGYYKDCPLYYNIFNNEITGIFQVPVVHCTYLMQREVFDKVCYDDNSQRYEYVIFSNCLRYLKVPQYIDNRRTYGILTFDDDKPMDQNVWLDELKRYNTS
jgi:hypothetical protein